MLDYSSVEKLAIGAKAQAQQNTTQLSHIAPKAW
jgi:hypothetical protein